VNRVTVLRDTTAAQFSAILALQPRGYFAAIARALLTTLPHRVALKLRPPHLDGTLSPGGA
jgi:hypothetical protein